MARDKRYQKLLNSRRWKELRAWKLRQNPLCEMCIEEGEKAGIKGGYISSAVDIHHIIPVETGKTEKEMEQLCFDPSNLQALCIPCHARIHKEMGKGTRLLTMERKNDALERWKAQHDPNYKPNKDTDNGKDV